jgi:hypothetical protein
MVLLRCNRKDPTAAATYVSRPETNVTCDVRDNLSNQFATLLWSALHTLGYKLIFRHFPEDCTIKSTAAHFTHRCPLFALVFLLSPPIPDGINPLYLGYSTFCVDMMRIPMLISYHYHSPQMQPIAYKYTIGQPYLTI